MVKVIEQSICKITSELKFCSGIINDVCYWLYNLVYSKCFTGYVTPYSLHHFRVMGTKRWVVILTRYFVIKCMGGNVWIRIRYVTDSETARMAQMSDPHTADTCKTKCDQIHLLLRKPALVYVDLQQSSDI